MAILGGPKGVTATGHICILLLCGQEERMAFFRLSGGHWSSGRYCLHSGISGPFMVALEETDILTKKPIGQFGCLYHVGTRLGDLENATKAPKSVVPYIATFK